MNRLWDWDVSFIIPELSVYGIQKGIFFEIRKAMLKVLRDLKKIETRLKFHPIFEEKSVQMGRMKTGTEFVCTDLPDLAS